jgi:hypothetical protein
VGAELIHADGQTDMMKLKIAFRNFVKTPKTRRHLVALTETQRSTFNQTKTLGTGSGVCSIKKFNSYR